MKSSAGTRKSARRRSSTKIRPSKSRWPKAASLRKVATRPWPCLRRRRCWPKWARPSRRRFRPNRRHRRRQRRPSRKLFVGQPTPTPRRCPPRHCFLHSLRRQRRSRPRAAACPWPALAARPSICPSRSFARRCWAVPMRRRCRRRTRRQVPPIRLFSRRRPLRGRACHNRFFRRPPFPACRSRHRLRPTLRPLTSTRPEHRTRSASPRASSSTSSSFCS